MVTPEASEGAVAPPHGGSLARSGLGVALQPYLQEGTGRLAVAAGSEATETVVEMVQQAQQAAAKSEA